MVDMDMIRTINTSAHDLRGIADGSVQAVITSPPYYGLRSYAGDQDVEWPSVTYRLNEWTEPVTVQGCEPGCAHEWVEQVTPPKHGDNGIDGSTLGGGKATQAQAQRTPITSRYCLHCGGWRGPLGLEPSPVAYIGHLILCLREWRRVLRDDGVVFCNLGDSYAGSGGAGGDYNGGGLRDGQPKWKSQFKAGETVKPKDLLMIPAMFAIAARADGWWLRSAVVWAKGVSFLPDYAGSVMPESVTDRPTKAYEMVFILAKSERYFYDAEAVKEASTGQNGAAVNFKRATKEQLAPGQAATQHRDNREPTADNGTRNLRDVWCINPAPYKAAHYAVFPPKLVEPMIRASTSERGCCPNCGAAWRRVVETPKYPKDLRAKPGDDGVKVGYGHKEVNTTGSGQAMQNWRNENPPTTLGWQPTCTCDAGDPVPCTVLDPFAGSGTTGRVAVSLGRAAILVDVSAEYLTQHVPERTTVQIGLPQL